MCEIEEPGRKTSSALELEGVDRAGHHPAQRLVRVGDALGRAGAARGEEDRRGVGRIGGRQVGGGLGLEQPREAVRGPAARAGFLLGRVAVGDRAQRQRAGQPARGQILLPLGMGDDRRGAADLERMVDLAVRIAVVERGDDEPRLEAGEVVDHQRDPVRHQRGDPVAALQPQLEVGAGQPQALVLQLTPAKPALGRDQRDLVRTCRQPHAQQLVQRRRRRLQSCPVDQHRRDATQAMARVGIEPTTPRFSASLGAFGALRLPSLSLLLGGFRYFADPRLSAAFGRRVDLALT